MSEVIIAALVSAAAAIVVGLINSRAQHNKLIAELDKRDELQAYRIGQLERKVDKHNQVIERTYKLEEFTELLGERIAFRTGAEQVEVARPVIKVKTDDRDSGALIGIKEAK